MEFKLEEINDWIKVYINGTLHLFLNKKKLSGFQSWKFGKKEWCIEFSYPNSTIFCAYDDEEKWKSILALLDKNLFSINQ